MPKPNAVQARYADWRPVKGRKVLQIILEVPLEQQGEILGLLGAPLPDRDLWVAIALLSDQKNDAYRGGKIAQEAGILCGQGAFRQWAAIEGQYDGIHMLDGDMAAEFIRERCGVTSRAHLDHDPGAAKEFIEIKRAYEAWLKVAA